MSATETEINPLNLVQFRGFPMYYQFSPLVKKGAEHQIKKFDIAHDAELTTENLLEFNGFVFEIESFSQNRKAAGNWGGGRKTLLLFV
jgi:hypothetical protein